MNCETCDGPMHPEAMRHASKDEIEEVWSEWPYESGGWVCRECGEPVESWQVKNADPRSHYNH